LPVIELAPVQERNKFVKGQREEGVNLTLIQELPEKREGGAMKRKAMIMALVCVVGLTMAVGTAQATWYTCTIQQAGLLAPNYYVVYLTDVNNAGAVSTPFIIYSADPAYVNAMYAAALTALSNRTNVTADLSGWTPWGTASTLWAKND
jgi:hypothetical protein